MCDTSGKSRKSLAQTLGRIIIESKSNPRGGYRFGTTHAFKAIVALFGGKMHEPVVRVD